MHDANIPFTLIENHLVSEPNINAGESPIDYVVRLAKTKVQASLDGHQGLILGADTVVTLNQKIYGKPSTESEALSFLLELMGQAHQVVSAAVVYNTAEHKFHECVDTSVVHFTHIEQDQIVSYIREYQPLDKAGAYGIQDEPPFLDRFEGDYNTILGLPMKHLYQLFSSYGIVK